MRHAVAIAKRSLPIPVALSAVVRALIPAASLAPPAPVPHLPALDTAIALPAVIPQADVKPHTAVEALDLDEVNRIRPSHDAARRTSTSRPAGARLYSSRGRASTSLRRLPGRPVPGRSGPCHLAGAERTSPAPPTPRLRRGSWRAARPRRNDDQNKEKD
jgi:hypothetical protein